MARHLDLDIPVIGLEDYIVNKRAAGRLKDLADVEACVVDRWAEGLPKAANDSSSAQMSTTVKPSCVR